MLATQRGNGQWAFQTQCLAQFRRAFDELPQGLGHIGRLVDHGAPIDHVDQPPRQLRPHGQRDQPDGHHRGLAQAGGQVQGAWHAPGHQVMQ